MLAWDAPTPASTPSHSSVRVRGSSSTETIGASQRELDHQLIEQADEIDRRHRIGAAAAKGDPRYPRIGGKQGRHQRDLAVQGLEIAVQSLLAVGGGRVAAAIPANLLAERDMDVERDVAGRCSDRICQVERTDSSVNSAAVG